MVSLFQAFQLLPLSDFDPMWLVHSHPCSIFPHGTGACPEGMSLETWAKGIICRYPKTRQYAQNIGFITDAFNIIQRHEAYKHAAVQMRISPGMASGIHGLTEVTLLQEVMKVLTTKKAGTQYKKTVASLPRAAQNLLNCVKITGARRVIGSPHSFRSLRCKVLGANVLWGHYTCMLNLCPTESGSHWTFKLAGEEFSFDSFGAPDQQRPNTAKVMATISANPKACADFIYAYFNAFCEVFLGWPMGRFASSNKVRDTTRPSKAFSTDNIPLTSAAVSSLTGGLKLPTFSNVSEITVVPLLLPAANNLPFAVTLELYTSIHEDHKAHDHSLHKQLPQSLRDPGLFKAASREHHADSREVLELSYILSGEGMCSSSIEHDVQTTVRAGESLLAWANTTQLSCNSAHEDVVASVNSLIQSSQPSPSQSSSLSVLKFHIPLKLVQRQDAHACSFPDLPSVPISTQQLDISAATSLINGHLTELYGPRFSTVLEQHCSGSRMSAAVQTIANNLEEAPSLVEEDALRSSSGLIGETPHKATPSYPQGIETFVSEEESNQILASVKVRAQQAISQLNNAMIVMETSPEVSAHHAMAKVQADQDSATTIPAATASHTSHMKSAILTLPYKVLSTQLGEMAHFFFSGVSSSSAWLQQVTPSWLVQPPNFLSVIPPVAMSSAVANIPEMMTLLPYITATRDATNMTPVPPVLSGTTSKMTASDADAESTGLQDQLLESSEGGVCAVSSACLVLQRAMEEFVAYRFPRQTNVLAFFFGPTELLDLSLSFGIEVFEPGHKTPIHMHPTAHELFFVLAGSGDAYSDGHHFRVKPGDVAVFPPGSKHGLDNNSSQEKLYCLQLMTPDEAFVQHVMTGTNIGHLADEDICNLTNRHC
ncbi:hypothetical protein CEUSTIGMA_g3801.t1 [Chlamydomonas eustigma]|uniref:Cupin type-1 domain-containing protein n=1 Tax=Chlamydomonas eustigma TaxID=1157962 RepID=A0A250WZX9_9CHLO|nr:hypothetical protein CEUSTIGMA_g3801.t1 [Chlamydomonas eustigma]|eukprot:GAX76355.1 hypothetical protein CEUSTIGMA_g3801.t1 [Chlamydomonas eustigma]